MILSTLYDRFGVRTRAAQLQLVVVVVVDDDDGRTDGRRCPPRGLVALTICALEHKEPQSPELSRALESPNIY